MNGLYLPITQKPKIFFFWMTQKQKNALKKEKDIIS